MPVITIDGNIGSGKSTILENLQKNQSFSALDFAPRESTNADKPAV